MTTLADLLDPEQVQALTTKAKDLPYVVTKAATDPNPPKQETPAEQHTILLPEAPVVDVEVTRINGVEYDLRPGFTDTACADCETPLRVAIAPEGADLEALAARPRVAVCTDCGQARIRDRRGTVVYRAPIQTPIQKEHPEVDLTDFSKAELAALAVEARERMVAAKAEALPAKRGKAKREQAERDEADEAQKVADRDKRNKKSRRLGAFTFHGVDVPALKLGELSSLDVAPSATVRSPYNKVLHRAGQERLDPETVTYRVLRKTHKRLFTLAESGESVPQGERLVADLDPQAKAKVEAFAQATGKDVTEAREHLVSLGLI